MQSVIVYPVISMKLTDAKMKKYYRITNLDFDCISEKRMICMGMYPGACISIERKNQSKAVMLVYVCGNLIMLRYRDAQGIEVELL